MSLRPVYPVVRVTSTGDARGGTKVVLVSEDGTELDISNVVTKVTWCHDAREVPYVTLEVMPGTEIHAEGFTVHYVPAPS